MMMTRRRAAATILAGLGTVNATARALAAEFDSGLTDRLRQIERDSGGRLGVSLRDTTGTVLAAHRAAERFPMSSTFKLLAAAAVLAKVDAGQERLDRLVVYAPDDVVAASPATKDRTGPPGMSLAALCEAAITLSDNTAGNLLLASLGGPSGLTAFCRTLGDESTRLDRIETALNEATPGDPRDTTTPEAMTADMQRLLLGDALSAASRTTLTGWLLANKTGGARLRAGLPPDWRVGDKTGLGGHGSNNDVAILWPPGGAPILLAVYLTETAAPPARSNATLAAVATAVASTLRR